MFSPYRYPKIAANAAYLLAGLKLPSSEELSKPSHLVTSHTPSLSRSDKCSEYREGLRGLADSLVWLARSNQPIIKRFVAANFNQAAALYTMISTQCIAEELWGEALKAASVALQCRIGAKVVLQLSGESSSMLQPPISSQKQGVVHTLSSGGSAVCIEHDHDDILPTVLEAVADVMCHIHRLENDHEALNRVDSDFHNRNIVDATFLDGVALLSGDKFELLNPEKWMENWKNSMLDGSLIWQSIPGWESGTPVGEFGFGETWYGLQLPCSLTLEAQKPGAVLEHAVKLYNQALVSFSDRRISCVQKLGNSLNMLGSLHLETSAAVDTSQGPKAVESADRSYRIAYDYLTRALEAFKGINDQVNVAITNLNLAKLFRVAMRSAVLENCTPQDDSREVHKRCWELHNQALLCYINGETALENRSTARDAWDTINLERAGTYLSFAIILQDRALGSDEARELLIKATKGYAIEARLSDCGEPRPLARSQTVALKAAEAHRRLTRLYLTAALVPSGRVAAKLGERQLQQALEWYGRASLEHASIERLGLRTEAAGLILAAGGWKNLVSSLKLIVASSTDLSSVSSTTVDLSEVIASLRRVLCKALLGLIKLSSGHSHREATATELRCIYSDLLKDEYVSKQGVCAVLPRVEELFRKEII